MWSLSDITSDFLRRGDEETDTCRGKITWRHMERMAQKKATLPIPRTWISSLQNCETMHFCSLSHPGCGALLWQPEQTNTDMKERERLRNCSRWKETDKMWQLSATHDSDLGPKRKKRKYIFGTVSEMWMRSEAQMMLNWCQRPGWEGCVVVT